VGRLRTTIYCAALTLAAVSADAGHALAQTPATSVFEARWKVTLPEGPAAPAAFDEAHAYVPLRSGKLVALALEDGKSIWTSDVRTIWSPAAGAARVFVASGSQLRAFDAATGREQWRTSLDQPLAVAPVFDTGWLFAGTTSGLLFALRATDGAVLWKIDLGAPLSAPPVPSELHVYLPVADGRIVAAELAQGKAVWTRTLPARPSPLMVLNDRLFVGTEDNFFYCLSRSNGGEKWKWRTGGDIVSAPIVDDDRVFFLSLDHMLRALDRDGGSLRWQRPVPNRTIGGPLRIGAFVAVAGLAPQLHAFNAADGKPVGSTPAPEGEALSSALVAEPRLVSVGDRDGIALLTRQGLLEVFTLIKK
jgi:outer membrane protein assembly factor BamB